NTTAITETLRKKVASELDRPAGSVTIGRSASGGIVFTGLGLPGRKTDLALAAHLVREALERNISHITLPVEETNPAVTVTDPDLQNQGIKEFVTVGESDYTGSPVNRRHNIAVGIARFNGTLIPKDSDFSFVKVLGPVDAKAGYRKELVIKGDRTEPDYGGGLCQISTTAYRGVWEYGFPILKRRNHSYSVHYYSPSGTDATVYPGSADMVFKNDSPAALLMQTYAEDGNAYFVYYGTRDDRQTELVGPFVTAGKPAPPPRTELTIEIPPGTKQKVGSPVSGLYAEWFRVITKNGKETTDRTSSIYEARPLYTLVGVTPEELPPPEIVPVTPLDDVVPVF
ncbi:VanW family protein, partial [Candidatus Peregrinibacteria bacterium]|nr:VanW family protein [Candidatus Peregrinibacteria bacterium]